LRNVFFKGVQFTRLLNLAKTHLTFVTMILVLSYVYDFVKFFIFLEEETKV